jgi:hypothetical protein
MAESCRTPAEQSDDWWLYDDADEPVCETCGGEGGDPLNDYCIPCPECGQ